MPMTVVLMNSVVFYDDRDIKMDNISTTRDTYTKLNIFWKFIENKGLVTLDIFLNFASASSYLQTKTFAWKLDCKYFQNYVCYALEEVLIKF